MDRTGKTRIVPGPRGTHDRKGREETAGISLSDVTGVILAGGASSRMGSNKALLPLQGGRFIEIIYRKMTTLFPHVSVVTNSPEQYGFLPCRSFGDIFPGSGPLGGIHAALSRSATPYIFAVACDMPLVDAAVVRMMARAAGESHVIVADCGRGPEPLHAFYATSCLPAVETVLREGRRNIISFFEKVAVRKLTQAQVAEVDPGFRSFRNINTPEEYHAMRSERITNNYRDVGLSVPLAKNQSNFS